MIANSRDPKGYLSTLTGLVEEDDLMIIEKKIKKNVNDFNSLPNGSKLKASSELYAQNQLLKGLGEIAIDVIERMDEQIEVKDNKITFMEKELKDLNQYDEEKMNEVLRRKPVIREVKGERARRKLKHAIIEAKKSLKEQGFIQ